MRLRSSHLGITNKGYNEEQLQSKNILTVPVQVSSFMTLKSLIVNQFTGVKFYTSGGKKMGGQKERRERRREGRGKKSSWGSGTWRSKSTLNGGKKMQPTLEFPATYWLLFGKNS